MIMFFICQLKEFEARWIIGEIIWRIDYLRNIQNKYWTMNKVIIANMLTYFSYIF